MKKILYISIILIICFIGKANVSFAASVSFGMPTNKVNVGDTFEVLIKADSDGELINSVDMSVNYPSDIVSFSGYKTDETAVKLWLTPPKENSGKINFTGIIPGGVIGIYDAKVHGIGEIPITRLLFTANKTGTGDFSFNKSLILRNDGKGTSLLNEQNTAQLTIGDSKEGISNIVDTIPPESFSVDFLESSIFSKTPSMIIFQAQDLGSGIKKYQIKIGRTAWRDATSPWQVSKSIFAYDVSVRAIDNYGNFRDENVRIPGLVSTGNLALIIILIIISSFWVYKLLKYKHEKPL